MGTLMNLKRRLGRQLLMVSAGCLATLPASTAKSIDVCSLANFTGLSEIRAYVEVSD